LKSVEIAKKRSLEENDDSDDNEDDVDAPQQKLVKHYHRWDALGRWDILSCDTYSQQTLNMSGIIPVVQIKQKAIPTGRFQFCCCSAKIEVQDFDESIGKLSFKFKGSWEYDKYSGTGFIELDKNDYHKASMTLKPRNNDLCQFKLEKSNKEFEKIEVFPPVRRY
jgi:hypothetical protein